MRDVPIGDEVAVPIQPRPKDTMVTYYATEAETVTTINREWWPGDAGEVGRFGRCTRCFECIARRNKCQMSVGMEIPEARAWDHSPRSLGARIEPR